MSDGLRNSVSGEEDLLFSSSSNSADVVIWDASRTGGIPTTTGARKIGDPRTSEGCEVLPDLAASPCCKACEELCACIPAWGGGGKDGLRGSGSPFLGLKVGISSGVLKSSREISDGVECAPEVRACLMQSLGEDKRSNFEKVNDLRFPRNDCVVSGTPQHVVDESPNYLHWVLRRYSLTQPHLQLDLVSRYME